MSEDTPPRLSENCLRDWHDIHKVSGINGARDLRVSHSLSDSIESKFKTHQARLGWLGWNTRADSVERISWSRWCSLRRPWA